MSARVEYNRQFDLFKAFDTIQSSHISDFFSPKILFSFIRVQYVLGYHLSTMDCGCWGVGLNGGQSFFYRNNCTIKTYIGASLVRHSPDL